MDILISQNKEIQIQLDKTKELLDNSNHIQKPIIDKISIINKKLLDISETLTKLNIDIKKKNKITLTKEEKEYIENDRQSDQLLANIMPALSLLSLFN